MPEAARDPAHGGGAQAWDVERMHITRKKPEMILFQGSRR
jgi:hypothetical protein